MIVKEKERERERERAGGIEGAKLIRARELGRDLTGEKLIRFQ